MAGEYPVALAGGTAHAPQNMVGHVDPTYLYGCYVRPSGRASAYKYNRNTGVYQTFDLFTMTGNPLELPIFDMTDTHYELACGVDDQDKLWITGNHHEALSSPTTGDHVICCTNTSSFTTDGSWSVPADAEPGSTLDSSANGGTYTYSYFDRLSNGALIWLQSQSPTRASSRGRCILAWIKQSGASWAPLMGGATANARLFFTSSSAASGTEADRAYVLGLQVEPRSGFDFVHVVGIWRTGDADPNTQQKPFYLYADSRDFSKWYAADGTLFQLGAASYPSVTASMPIHWFNHTSALITGAPPISYVGRYSLAIDPSTGTSTTPGRPSMLLRNGDQSSANGIGDPVADPWLRYVWSGSAWSNASAASLTGEMRELYVGGHHFWRSNQGNRVTLKEFGSTKTYPMGTRINTTSGGAFGSFSPEPCPVLLRQGAFVANIPDGATPKIFRWPTGASA